MSGLKPFCARPCGEHEHGSDRSENEMRTDPERKCHSSSRRGVPPADVCGNPRREGEHEPIGRLVRAASRDTAGRAVIEGRAYAQIEGVHRSEVKHRPVLEQHSYTRAQHSPVVRDDERRALECQRDESAGLDTYAKAERKRGARAASGEQRSRRSVEPDAQPCVVGVEGR